MKMKKAIAMVLAVVMMLALGTTAFADNTPLTVEQAKQAALNFAGVNASEATFTKAYKGYDDGREVYEIEFYANNTEYDMDVDVYTGRITDFSTEYHGMQAARGYGFWDDDMYDHDWDDMYDWDDPWDFD
jgi:uncharacterized membrane protein YkoI